MILIRWIMNLTTLYLISITLILTQNVSADPDTSSNLSNNEIHAQSLIQWLTSKPDGFFHPLIEMRPSDPSNPDSRLGIFAKDDISANTVIIRIPKSMILDSTEANPQLTPLVCGTVRNLVTQIKLRNESDYAPYTSYLLSTQRPNKLPSGWSIPGKKLLLRLLGDNGNKSEPMLPPEYPIDWITDDWEGECEGSSSIIDKSAALLVVSHASDDLMIPVYDILNHRNGRWLNTATKLAGDRAARTSVEVSAKRRILKGEQLHSSQNMCEDCGARHTSFGTPELFRDYGFIEKMPQSWIFSDIGVGFRIDEKKGGIALVEWINGESLDEEKFEALKDLMSAVIERKKSFLSNRDKTVPDREWNKIVEYADALEVALKVALASSKIQDLKCIEQGTCTIETLERYADLSRRKITVTTDVGNDWPTCNDSLEMAKFSDGTYKLVDEVKSPYQHVSFMMRPVDRETCLGLDGRIQICDSYRPHYHELQVHQAARYLKSMKRALFVGGGDSMFLHEFLKYPDIELIVGLEIDQRVVRGSFKHFGAQPHFDDDRVEWWFGDATKSLMMLPKNYFGSFDIVVVDLSETVMAFTVTKKLDVIEALTLLLKPDGVFIKNEFYYGQFRTMFPYSVQMHWYDNPVICSQGIVLGSYLIDFMKTEQTNFGVDGLLIEPVEKLEDPYAFYHDYTRNHTSHQICDDLLDDEDDGTTKVQTGSPGILFIVEAENVAVDLTNVNELKSSLTAALEKEGVTIVSTTTTATNGGSIFTLITQEGYVVARAMPEHKYCGFDVHFWTSLDKQQNVKNALVGAVGIEASSSSTFRVIAGGIFGISSWEEDEKSRGPQYGEICEQRSRAFKAHTVSPYAEKEMGKVDQNTIESVLKESILLAPGQNKRIAVLIGNDGKSGLSSALKDMDHTEVETLYCPSMLDFNRFKSTALDKATVCEGLLTNRLIELAKQNTFDMLMIDSTADKLTASILLKIFSARRKNFITEVLDENALILSLMLDDSEKWRQNVIQLFKVDVFKFDPSWYIEVGVADSSGKMKILLAKTGEHFIQRLNKAVIAFEEKSKLSIDVQLVDGGKFVFQEDPFEPTRSFLPSDYDKTSPLKQWKSQVPLGHQIIFQMEIDESTSRTKSLITAEVVKENLEIAIMKAGIPGLDLSKDAIEEYTDIGDGCVVMTTWSGGSIVVLWDGRNHIDVNYFTYEENVEQANAFESAFRTSKDLTTKLRDEQPRGVGKVVSYFSDLDGNLEPHWAI